MGDFTMVYYLDAQVAVHSRSLDAALFHSACQVCCRVLHFVAVWCSVWPCVAGHSRSLHDLSCILVPGVLLDVALCGNVLQNVLPFPPWLPNLLFSAVMYVYVYSRTHVGVSMERCNQSGGVVIMQCCAAGSFCCTADGLSQHIVKPCNILQHTFDLAATHALSLQLVVCFYFCGVHACVRACVQVCLSMWWCASSST